MPHEPGHAIESPEEVAQDFLALDESGRRDVLERIASAPDGEPISMAATALKFLDEDGRQEAMRRAGR
jgi:hypothetical protein